MNYCINMHKYLPFSSAPSVYDCNFEQSLCTWTQSLADNFNWTRKQGSTASIGTGPKGDHTTGGSQGYYVFIETSLPRKPNETAQLVSSSIPSTRQKCLQFWYHMYGAHVDTLNIYTKVGSNLGSAVWTKKGTKGDKWWQGSVELTVSSNFQVINPSSQYKFSWPFKNRCMSEVMRIDSSVSFYLSKLSNAKFSILYDISLVRDWKRKLKLITVGSERVKGADSATTLSCLHLGTWLIKLLKISTKKNT